MDTELYTRNSMTGFVFVCVLLLIFFCSGNAYNSINSISQRHLVTSSVTAKQNSDGSYEETWEAKPLLSAGFWTVLLTAFVGAPAIGFGISSLVLFTPRYVFRIGPYPYHGRNRREFTEWIMDNNHLRNGLWDPEAVFAYFQYQDEYGKRIEWGRRRYTAQLTDMNWAVATVFGLVIGLWVSYGSVGHWLSCSVWSLLIVLFFFVVFITMSIAAGRQADQFDGFLMDEIKSQLSGTRRKKAKTERIGLQFEELT
jgi:hypothetical protein